MEAGNRCFDQRVPEETNRKIVDHVADINMTYSSIAREYLLAEGLSPDRVIKTGSPMYEVLMFNKKEIDKSKFKYDKKIIFSKPLGFFDYVNLQMNASVVLSDSGTISEESSILNFPALNIREAHERPEAMEEASVMMVGLNYKRIQQAIEILKLQPRDQRVLREVEDYKMPNVSEKVSRIIHSYTDYVNKKIWFKK